MGRVKLDINKLMTYAEAEAMGGMRKGADRICMAGKLSAPVGHTTRNQAAGGRKVQFLARKGKSKTNYRLVQYKTKSDFMDIRRPGMLRDSIRVVEKPSKKHNLRVYMGDYRSYYAHFVERGTRRPTKAHWVMKNAAKANTGYVMRQMNQAMKIACDRSNQIAA